MPLYLTVVALIPEVILSQLNVSQFIGGTSLLIMVTVTLDTITPGPEPPDRAAV